VECLEDAGDNCDLFKLRDAVEGSKAPAFYRALSQLEEMGSQWRHGNLGLDLLNQARAVTIDFESMTLVLE
jgi:hypothetical protein